MSNAQLIQSVIQFYDRLSLICILKVGGVRRVGTGCLSRVWSPGHGEHPIRLSHHPADQSHQVESYSHGEHLIRLSHPPADLSHQVQSYSYGEHLIRLPHPPADLSHQVQSYGHGLHLTNKVK
jgi:hypothetical protein